MSKAVDLPQVTTHNDLHDIPIVQIDAASHQLNNAVPGGAKVRVVAPSALSAGYLLPVNVNGQSRVVQVPAGGVLQGEAFEGILVDDMSSNPHSIPKNGWRDHLFDCCSLGCCHPLLCLSFWFTPVALGQVLARTKLDACGSPNKSAKYSPFTVLLSTFIIYLVLDLVLSAITAKHRKDGSGWFDYYTGGNHLTGSSYWFEGDAPGWAYAVESFRHVIGFVYSIWILVVMIRTRQYIMRKSNITAKCCPTACDGGLESCCVSVWCGCCAVSQMARHTGDYQAYRAACCTDTGLIAAPDSYSDIEGARPAPTMTQAHVL